MLTFVWSCWSSWCYANDVNVRVKLLKFLGWGGVGWGMLTFVWSCWSSWCYRHNRCRMDVLQEIRAKEFACPKCGLDSLLQNVAMEIHPHVQKLSESNGVQTARDIKKGCRLLRRLELVWIKNCVSPRRNTHLSKKPPNSDVWISEFLGSLNCVFA